MNWYITKIVFQIDINRGELDSQFDESVRLVEADSLTDAFHKARGIGKKEEVTFINHMNDHVEWKFIDVADVYDLHSIKHGTEVYSSTYVDYRPVEYISIVKSKAQAIQKRSIILS